MTYTETAQDVGTLDVEGQAVRCFKSSQNRLRRCGCEYFQRMLTQHDEGCCPHAVVAISEAIRRGALHTEDLHV